ncbi:Flp family type IVb pilin [Flexivirga sp. B27]
MSKTLITLQSRLVDAVQGKKDRGATMVEYGLLVALIAVIVAVAATTLGEGIAGLFDEVTAQL